MNSFFTKYKKPLTLFSSALAIMIIALSAMSFKRDISIDDSDAAVTSFNIKPVYVFPEFYGVSTNISGLNGYVRRGVSEVLNELRQNDVDFSIQSELLITDSNKIIQNTGYSNISELEQCNTSGALTTECTSKMNGFKKEWFSTSGLCSAIGDADAVILPTPGYLLPDFVASIGTTELTNEIQNYSVDCGGKTRIVISPSILSVDQTNLELFKKRVLNSFKELSNSVRNSFLKYTTSSQLDGKNFKQIASCTESTSYTTCLNNLKSIPSINGADTITLLNNREVPFTKNVWSYLLKPSILNERLNGTNGMAASCSQFSCTGGTDPGTTPGGETGVCPASTQPRFVLTINGVSSGLISNGEKYSIDNVDSFTYQILQNQSTSDFFNGRILLKRNGVKEIEFTGIATTKVLYDLEVGTYTLEAYKGSSLCGSASVVIEQGTPGADFDTNTDVNGNPTTEGSQAIVTCQARFSVKLKNKPTREALTQDATYEYSRIENISWVVVNNMQTNPPLYHTKKVTLKTPGSETVQTFSGGEPRYIATIEEGKYVLKAYKGGEICSKAKLVVTEDTTASRCETFKPVAGFYRTSSNASTFIKEGSFNSPKSEFKYSVVVPDASGNISDTPAEDDLSYFKGRIVVKVDDQITDEYIRQRVKPTPLPTKSGSKYTVEAYDANTNELCSTSTITFSVIEGNTTCGPLDIDDNEVADVHDLANFARKYNKSCTDDVNTYDNLLCRGKDTNKDGKVDIIDLARFGELYQKPSCEWSQTFE